MYSPVYAPDSSLRNGRALGQRPPRKGRPTVLAVSAYLSISLGVLNLLPIPVLDGGHLLFYLVEWVRGRPLSERVQGWGVQIGISLVVGVMLLALVNDLGRL